jgi:hypothetical protein
VRGDRVFVSGDFTSIGGSPQPRQFFAALDTVNGEATDWNPGASDVGNVLRLAGDTLYAGGYFTEIAGAPRKYLAAFHASTGDLLDWHPDPDGPVLALDGVESTLYVGGLFQLIGGQWRPCLAAVDVASGAALPWDPQVVPGVVDALLANGNAIYVGGAFTQIGGQARNAIAALERTTGMATSWDPQPAGWGSQARVRTLAMVDGTLCVGGDFATMGGQPRICLAAVDTRTALATAWNPGLDGLVWSLRADANDLYAGGGFTRAGGVPAVGLAAFSTGTQPGPNPLALTLASIPNPARDNTLIRFTLPQAATVSVSLFDLQGRRVARVLDAEFRDAGRHDIPLRTNLLRPGIYLCCLDAGDRRVTRKMVIIE